MFIKRLVLLTFVFLFTKELKAQESSKDLKLWYLQPAKVWEEALPLGNGRIGGMVFGKVKKERIQLNDNTLWSGEPGGGDIENGEWYLKQVRELIFKKEYDSATVLWKKHMQGPYSARYLPLADLWLDFDYDDSVGGVYNRELDISNAIHKVSYTVNDIQYTRTSFISYPDKVMAMHIVANKKNAINFHLSLSSKLEGKVTTNSNTIVITGKAPSFVANSNIRTQTSNIRRSVGNKI